ncbi:MAG: hypothetical protein R3336_08185 [Phycisphaeraceae bacterium]|nr:hypothetical protein [Phycisphaeraceae bacterium]
MTELLITIAVLMVLVGIATVSGVNIKRAVEARTTRTLTQAGENVAGEYYAVFGENINSHPGSSEPIDWGEGTIPNLDDGIKESSIERLVWAATQIPDIDKQLASLRDGLGDVDGNGHEDVVDAWGTKLIYLPYAGQRSDSGDDDQDDFLPLHGSPGSPQPFVASAGPDMLWGDVTSGEDENNDGTPDHEDNIYSYEIE